MRMVEINGNQWRPQKAGSCLRCYECQTAGALNAVQPLKMLLLLFDCMMQYIKRTVLAVLVVCLTNRCTHSHMYTHTQSQPVRAHSAFCFR